MLVVSAAIHMLFPIGLLILPARISQKPEEPEPVEVVFYSPPRPEVPLAPPEAAQASPRPEPVEIAQLEPPPPRPAAPPEPVARASAPPAPRERSNPPPEPPAEPRPTIPRRQARTGMFASAETENPQRPVGHRAPARAAGFEQVETDSSARRAPSRVIASGSFGDPIVPPPPPARGRGREAVRTGFAGEVAEASTTARSGGSVKHGAFGSSEVDAPAPRTRERPAENLDTPVAIVSKPKPAYTEQARQMRIEGEVKLEVTFRADGELRVLRVVEGLGHGLDEAAVAAAEKIRFEPARRDGRPVDHTATLRVVFKLA